MAFWSASHLDHDDALNEEIWSDSAEAQSEIQPARPTASWSEGEIGAHQAMFGVSPLPWVPDLVGKEWRREDALLIVGSAYAQFVGRGAGKLDLGTYRRCRGAGEFIREFRSRVVDGRPYYKRVALLAGAVEGATAEQIALFDLCRTSFVEVKGNGKVGSGDGVAKKKPALFTRYIEDPRPRGWLWRRLTGGDARRVIALGTIAEHGLLRLFHAKGCSIRAGVTFGSSREDWPKHYAAPGGKVARWLDTGTWWRVESPTGRRWELLPVFHPSYNRNAVAHADPDYRRTRSLLGRMLLDQVRARP